MSDRRRRRPDWVPAFLAAIQTSANVRLATNAAGVDRSTPYKLAQRDPEFAAAWADAEQDAIDVLEATAWQRAMDGSDGLMSLMLKAHRPAKYRDTVEIRVDLRREAERIAIKLGLGVDEVLALAERRARELADR